MASKNITSKRGDLSAIFLLTLIGTARGAFSLTQTEACRMSQAVIPIKTERGFGTGFIVSSDGWIITAAHVVINPENGQPDQTIQVGMPDGSSMAAAVLHTTPDDFSRFHDSAILKIAATEPPLPAAWRRTRIGPWIERRCHRVSIQRNSLGHQILSLRNCHCWR